MTTDIKITSNETIEHDGKQYRPIAIRKPKKGDTVMSLSGHIGIADKDFDHLHYVILEEVIPPYRTPTDEDALKRPMAEFWDDEHDIKAKQELIAVLRGASHNFVSNNGGIIATWQNCRIPNEQATNDNL